MSCCTVIGLSAFLVSLLNKSTAIDNIVQICVPAGIVLELSQLKFMTPLNRCEKRISGVKKNYASMKGLIYLSANVPR